MARPRIEGMDEKIIDSFIDRKIFTNQKEVVSAALRALVREQKAREALERGEQRYTDEFYSSQLDSEREANESMGNLVRKTAER